MNYLISDFFVIISHGFTTASQVPVHFFLFMSHSKPLVAFTGEETELQADTD